LHKTRQILGPCLQHQQELSKRRWQKTRWYHACALVCRKIIGLGLHWSRYASPFAHNENYFSSGGSCICVCADVTRHNLRTKTKSYGHFKHLVRQKELKIGRGESVNPRPRSGGAAGKQSRICIRYVWRRICIRYVWSKLCKHDTHDAWIVHSESVGLGNQTVPSHAFFRDRQQAYISNETQPVIRLAAYHVSSSIANLNQFQMELLCVQYTQNFHFKLNSIWKKTNSYKLELFVKQLNFNLQQNKK